MSVKYVLVSDEEYGEAVELPLEDNGTLLLSTLSAQFPGASGLKFRTENNVVRGVRLADFRFHVPDNEWGKTPYYCVFPKGNFYSFKIQYLKPVFCFTLARLQLPMHPRYFKL